jgi:hypothetical protein
MKRANGKSNIDIVRGYLNGERPFIQVGYSPESEKYVIRQVGEEWTDSSGTKWKQTESGPQTVTRVMDMVREALNDKCSCCGREIRWGNHLDKKMFYKTKKCYDCVVEEEHQLRIKGQFKLYETKKLIENELSYLNDVKGYLRDSKEYLKEHKVLTFVNSNGHVEEWSNESRQELMRNLKKDWVTCLRKIRDAEAELAKVNAEIAKALA